MLQTERLFYCGLGGIYFLAFYSLYIQYDGLWSRSGVMPIETFVQNNGLTLPVVQVASFLEISLDGACELCLWLGIVSSALILVGVHNIIPLSLCWLCYWNMRELGQTFMSFQWDILLLEVGFASAVFSGWDSLFPGRQPVMNWCFRFMTFKLMFLSGVVKLQSRCPKWESLTALDYHFASQPLPTPLAWFAHQLPPIFLAAGVQATYLIEIPLALFLVSPFRIMRKIGAIYQWILQALIILTGNYTFFNLLTCLLMLKTWEDDECDGCASGRFISEGRNLYAAFRKIPSVTPKVKFPGPCMLFISTRENLEKQTWFRFADLAITALLSAYCVYLFNDFSGLLSGDFEWWRRENIGLKVTWPDIERTSRAIVAAATIVTVIHIFCYWMLALRMNSAMESKNKKLSVLSFCFVNLGCTVRSLVALLLTFLSVIMMSSICDVNGLFPHMTLSILPSAQHYGVSSGYGLFRHMTGTAELSKQDIKRLRRETNSSYIPSITSRPEIIIEGLHPKSNEWLEIPFRYKPGDLSKRPVIVAPHQPRLDWQMWFAALGSYNHHPWFIHLIYKLVNSKDHGERKYPHKLVSLLDEDEYPFKSGPPAAIRAIQYDYDFTRIRSPWSSPKNLPRATFVGRTEDKQNNTMWWSRQAPREYLFPITANHHGVEEYLRSNNVRLLFEDESPDQSRKYCLDKRRKHSKPASSKKRNQQGSLQGFTFHDIIPEETTSWVAESAYESTRVAVCGLLTLKSESNWISFLGIIAVPPILQTALAVAVAYVGIYLLTSRRCSPNNVKN